ncbi:glycerophosphodiester phosphodiesterase family protein [Desemzia sp. RIT804]|uniref:glycerophosphodiester phosphodiesterase family protein n=1 Tax=Desemzia sp. RIT 804 TaxID=2810209 RepID=UPI00194FFB77|nr:glycerophosphodiester phosphodiesterase family protein [Desemzia sp. RIT 804]MBM6614988.1 glycerophosphodiester phosphodiesterase family protein [Desemzia sp. RIT 804]
MKGNLFLEKVNKNLFLIMSHRGFWGGNIIENSIESSQLAFRAGADIVEVDVCRSSDKKYYLFHGGNEPKLLSRTENFKELSSMEIDNSEVYNSIGNKSGYKINTLSQFLNWLSDDKLVNLDRSWEYWNDGAFFKMLVESGKQDQLVLKSPVEKEYLDSFSKNGKSLSYIPIVKSKEEADLVLTYQDIHTIGLELVVADLQSDLLDPVWLEENRKNGLLTIVNAENLGSEFNLFGGLNDDGALLNDYDWNKFVELGIDVIQTDWPNFLFQYREKIEQVGE